jgi:hypothetical protein
MSWEGRSESANSLVGSVENVSRLKWLTRRWKVIRTGEFETHEEGKTKSVVTTANDVVVAAGGSDDEQR